MSRGKSKYEQQNTESSQFIHDVNNMSKKVSQDSDRLSRRLEANHER